MIVTPDQLSVQLKQTFSTCYLLTGNEPVLIQESIEDIKQAARHQGYLMTDITVIEETFNWEAWLAENQSLSLFSEKKIHLLYFTAPKLSETARNSLKKIADAPPSDHCYLFICPLLDSVSLKTKWYLSLQAQMTTLVFWPSTLKTQRLWLEKKLRYHDLSMQEDARQCLLERTQGNLLATKQYLDHLVLLYPARHRVSLSELLELISDQASFTLFDLVDACNLGQPNSCVHMLEKFALQGTEPILILWACIRELRILHALIQEKSLGRPLSGLYQQHRIPYTKQSIVSTAINRLSLRSIEALLIQALTLDRIIKGQAQLPLWPELTRWCLTYAGKEPTA